MVFIITGWFSASGQYNKDYYLGRNNWKVSGHPILGYTPETDLYFGLAGIFFYQPEDSSSKGIGTFNPFVVNTLNGQLKFVMLNEVYLKNYYINIRLETGSFPDYFYGIGNNAGSEKGTYEFRRSGFEGMSLFKFNKSFYAGPDFRFQYNNAKAISLMDLFEEYEIPKTEKGWMNGIGIAGRYDTRDNIFFPSSGMFLTFESYIYNEFLGSEYNFNQLMFNSRMFLNVINEKFILGLHGRISFLNGDDIPFFALTRIGGENRLRGILTNRYIDKKSLLFQAECRYFTMKRIGLVLFGGTGWVGENLHEFNPNQLKFSGGSGLRYRIFKNQKLNFRIDAGIGPDKQTGFYFGINEAF